VNVTDHVRAELLPLLDQIIRLHDREGYDRTADFFAQVSRQLADARDESDLMRPFLQLAGSAFVISSDGAANGAMPLIDTLLERAHTISHTLSAEPIGH